MSEPNDDLTLSKEARERAEKDWTTGRPDWLLEWQNYPHSTLIPKDARQLNYYAMSLEDALRKAYTDIPLLAEAVDRLTSENTVLDENWEYQNTQLKHISSLVGYDFDGQDEITVIREVKTKIEKLSAENERLRRDIDDVLILSVGSPLAFQELLANLRARYRPTLEEQSNG